MPSRQRVKPEILWFVNASKSQEIRISLCSSPKVLAGSKKVVRSNNNKLFFMRNASVNKLTHHLCLRKYSDIHSRLFGFAPWRFGGIEWDMNQTDPKGPVSKDETAESYNRNFCFFQKWSPRSIEP
jgi:hypothetical protein